jgi:hypothetical protein
MNYCICALAMGCQEYMPMSFLEAAMLCTTTSMVHASFVRIHRKTFLIRRLIGTTLLYTRVPRSFGMSEMKVNAARHIG